LFPSRLATEYNRFGRADNRGPMIALDAPTVHDWWLGRCGGRLGKHLLNRPGVAGEPRLVLLRRRRLPRLAPPVQLDPQ
jgi:hypothetical protein